MFDTREANLEAAIDLSIMATKIIHLSKESRDRIVEFVGLDVAFTIQSLHDYPADHPLLSQYLDLMQDHSAPDELKVAAFLYLNRSSQGTNPAPEGEDNAARTGEQGAINMERTLAGSD
jgi:hypothetical protein